MNELQLESRENAKTAEIFRYYDVEKKIAAKHCELNEPTFFTPSVLQS